MKWTSALRLRTRHTRASKDRKFALHTQRPIRIPIVKLFVASLDTRLRIQSSEERDQSFTKFLVRRDTVSDMRAADLLCFIGSEPCDNKIAPAISRTTTQREE